MLPPPDPSAGHDHRASDTVSLDLATAPSLVHIIQPSHVVVYEVVTCTLELEIRLIAWHYQDNG